MGLLDDKSMEKGLSGGWSTAEELNELCICLYYAGEMSTSTVEGRSERLDWIQVNTQGGLNSTENYHITRTGWHLLKKL